MWLRHIFSPLFDNLWLLYLMVDEFYSKKMIYAFNCEIYLYGK